MGFPSNYAPVSQSDIIEYKKEKSDFENSEPPTKQELSRFRIVVRKDGTGRETYDIEERGWFWWKPAIGWYLFDDYRSVFQSREDAVYAIKHLIWSRKREYAIKVAVESVE